MLELINQIIANPMSSFMMIMSVVLLECLLSVDNAAVIATMVMDLEPNQRKKALRYGIIGAYVFRGIALLTASFILGLWYIKPIGGLYLLYIAYAYFRDKNKEAGDTHKPVNESWIYKNTIGMLGLFWTTVVLVEMMDIAFSIDNIFAVVAFSNNIILIIFGVFVGILAMRFIAQGFVKLMDENPALKDAAFIVIAILGFKLTLSVLPHYYEATKWLESETTDLFVSALTVLVFVFPLMYKKFFKKQELIIGQ